MALYIASLNSGSNGNCYYIGNHKDAVLIDAGLSCRETEKRMKQVGLSMSKVRAIFISHEHSDHIKGVTLLSKKYNLPVYITTRTMQYGRLFVDERLAKTFIAFEPVRVNNINVTAFPKEHDAIEPHSFIVDYAGIIIGVFTDIGIPCDNLARHFQKCHAAFLEANYDTTMLELGKYPIHLKNRIRGGKGHLSNNQALQFFREYKPAHMSHLLLSHLSQDNNSPELVKELFETHANGVRVIIASRYQPSEVFLIENPLAPKYEEPKKEEPVQASLFG
ncbi:MBL fold metallo-hydrolase [Polluticoccus soli]|uniref:MBL fold metallo-hydrolase n=1 Tax=Polluticoccus soli TaxID=3034150 RepID=UPI0023E0BA32|nr:MBL fold metallo-hydrolase [Flavipsychrobacter sp. JY13-12]